MNNIASKSSETRTNNIRSTRPAESVETAGSLAMYQQHSLFETRVYDMFSTSNPFEAILLQLIILNILILVKQ